MDSQSQGYAYSNGSRSARASKTEPIPVKSSDIDPSLKFDRDTMAYVLEDTRLSTLQRKLVREGGSIKQMALAVQIAECVMYVDNRVYVRRSSDVICDAIAEIFYSSKHSDKVKTESAEAMARVAFVLAESSGTGVEGRASKETFFKLYAWIWKSCKETKRESIQVYYLKSISAFLKLKPPFLTDEEIQEILLDVKENLEKTESSSIMMALVDAFAVTSLWKAKLFEPHFQNIVDILVGWHIDSSQNPSVRSYVSKVLLSWHSFWIQDLDFSSDLLRSFMEDLESFTDDVTRAKEPSQMADCCERILSLIQVFNAVLSCLRSSMSRDRANVVSFLPPESSTWCSTILNCLLTALDKRFDEDMIVAGQHAFLMLLERIESLPQTHQAELKQFLSATLRNFDNFSFEGLTNVFHFTQKLFLALGSNSKLQRELVQQLLGQATSRAGLIHRSALTRSRKVWEASADFFRHLLNSKDILVLQEVYGHFMSLYQMIFVALADIPPFQTSTTALESIGSNQISKHQSEQILYFILECLSNLIVGKGSVLSMWALDPSIFVVLTQHSGILCPKMMIRYPWIHHALVSTLFTHCSSNGQFISSSQLISGSGLNSSLSPTSEHFKILLETTGAMLGESALYPTTLQLLTTWCLDILAELSKTQKSFNVLLDKEEFFTWVMAVLKATFKSARSDIKKDCFAFIQNLVVQISLSDIPFKSQTLLWNSVLSISSKELDSLDSELKEVACQLISQVPPLIAELQQVDKEEEDKHFLDLSTSIQAKMEFLRNAPVNLRLTDFNLLADSLLMRSPSKDLESRLLHVFESYSNDPAYSKLALSNSGFMVLWQNFQLAQSCVNNKLKTGLGKAQETLTSFEKVLRHLALLATQNKQVKVTDCHRLLGFFDLLEKSFVNAADGYSLNWSPPSKTIGTFFKANKKTCSDWLLRLRPSLIQLAFHVGDFGTVSKNADRALAYLADKLQAGNLSEQDEVQLVQIVTMLAVALRRLKATQNLTGLYVWCKEKTGKRFPWIRSLVELSRGRIEDGSTSFYSSLNNMLDSSSADPLVFELLNRELFSAHAQLCSNNEDYLFLASRYKAKMSATGNRNYSTDYLQTLSQFSDGRLPEVLKDSNDFVDLESVCSGTEDGHIRSHRLLLQSGALFQNSYTTLPSWNQSEKLGTSLSEARKQLNLILTDHQLTESQLQRTLILKSVQNELQSLTENRGDDLDKLLTHHKGCHDSSTLLLLKKWGEFFTRYRKNNSNYPRWLFQLNALHMELAVTARKEKNYNLSRIYLEKAFGTEKFRNYVEKFRFGSTCLSVDKASCLRQSAKLLKLEGDGELGVRILCGISVNVVTSMNFHNQNNNELLELSSRSLNNMAHWFRGDNSLLEKLYPDMVSPADDGITIGRVLELELSVSHGLPSTEAIAENDLVIYRLLHLAVCQAPTLSKIWNSFGNWCLELGEKTLATSEENRITLNADEDQTLIDIFNGEAVPKNVRNLIQQVHLKPSCQAAVETEKLALMKRDLTDCPELSDAPPELVERLHLLWQNVQRRIFFYHETAVNAYFKFISLCEDGAEDKIISATLRLLQLTVKHALELQESLQTGLATTPCGRWRSIIPQLFSRLNHPVRTVRNRISELLCRIAEEHSHLVIYPAVVGSMSSASSDTFSKLLSTNIVDEEKLLNGDEEDKSPEMQSAHAKIVDAIAKKSSSAVESIDQVRHMVLELQRISLLWDELWVGTIQQYGAEINRRVKKMEEEVNRLNVNKSLNEVEKKSLARDKYNIVFKPLLYVFEQVSAITSSPPETPNEKWFAKKYGDFLSSTMQKLREPPDPTRPQDVWSLLNQFLSQKLQKKSGLKLSEISTSLYNMRKSLVPMPGVVDDARVGLSIDSFDNLLTVLPTKTKPKRIMLTGSDGKKYTYLFKGLEDLHLDERIMQFLMIANKLMRKSGGEYRARHYSVVPLGVRSGLIQWVEGSVPLFGLYKRWQQRQQANSLQKGANFQKPSDVFYNKLIPLLREQGITNLDNRREWPLSVMRQVLTELQTETPDDLLAQEVWFSSVDSQHWFKLSQNLSRSIAVMSIIGYIIGLGDRHLDNLLIDLTSGEIIHIDYNVCFEKGRNLRIPEHVPCRLTQNIVRLFGVTGVEGVFRLSCEHTLETMRAGRETFLTLLEAFVYDPLVDWTPGVEMGLAGTYYQGGKNKNVEAAQDKRDIQTEITFSMLSVRVAEIRGAWFENRTCLVVAMTAVEEALTAWLDQNVSLQQLIANLARLHSAMSLLKEAEANPSHRLYALQDRYFEHTLTEAAVVSSQAKVAAFVEQHERWLHLHQRATTSLASNQLAAWSSEIEEVSLKATGGPPTSQIIQDFLEKAGQNSLLDELIKTETTFCKAMDKLKGELQACIQMLSHYATVALLYPGSYKSEHRTVKYVKWMSEIGESFTVQTCHDVVAEFNQQFVEMGDARRGLKQHHIINVNYQLETWSQELKFNVEKVYSHMMSLGIENSNGVARKVSQIKMNLQQFLQNENSDSVTRCFGALIFNQLSQNVTSLVSLEAKSKQMRSPSDVNQNLPVIDDVMAQISFAAQIINLADFFGANVSSNQNPSVKCFLKVDNVVKQLQALTTSFFGIIMQEAIKSFQREEPSTLAVSIQLNEIIGSAGISLNELIHELDSQVAFIVLSEARPFEASVSVARSLRTNFQNLIFKLTSRNKLSSGEMLILAFNSLFDNVATAHEDLRMTFRKTCENNLRSSTTENSATISECKSLLNNIDHRPDLEDLSDLITFMARLNTIKGFFDLCAASVSCFKADLLAIGQNFPTTNDLARPVRQFIVEFYRRQLVGMPSMTLCLSVVNFAESIIADLSPMWNQLSDLTKIVVEQLTIYPATPEKVQYLSLELNALCVNLEKMTTALALEQQLELLFASQQINMLQRNSFQWFHETELPMEALTPVMPIRPQLMTDLRNCVTVMLQSHEELVRSQSKFQELHGTVEQRMRWACGANPDLQEIFDTYSTAFSVKLDMLKSSTGIMKAVSSTTNTILQHEALRTATREALNSDSLFMSLVAECQQSASLRETEIQNQPLNDEELSLFAMNPPNPETDMVNSKWIRSTEEKISSLVKQVQFDISEEKKKERQVLLALKQSGNELRQVFVAKQKLMVDVGAILRNIDKSGEYELPEVSNYLRRYREFSDLVSNMVKETLSEELNEEIANSSLKKLEQMNEMIFPIYDDLVTFATTLKEENLEMFKTKRGTKGSGNVEEYDSVERGGETTKEEKNAFAMRVLRRIRTKLEGREPDSLKKSSVAEQVDFVIGEATHIDNLALLYEGWTAWI